MKLIQIIAYLLITFCFSGCISNKSQSENVQTYLTPFVGKLVGSYYVEYSDDPKAEMLSIAEYIANSLHGTIKSQENSKTIIILINNEEKKYQMLPTIIEISLDDKKKYLITPLTASKEDRSIPIDDQMYYDIINYINKVDGTIADALTKAEKSWYFTGRTIAP